MLDGELTLADEFVDELELWKGCFLSCIGRIEDGLGTGPVVEAEEAEEPEEGGVSVSRSIDSMSWEGSWLALVDGDMMMTWTSSYYSKECRVRMNGKSENESGCQGLHALADRAWNPAPIHSSCSSGTGVLKTKQRMRHRPLQVDRSNTHIVSLSSRQAHRRAPDRLYRGREMGGKVMRTGSRRKLGEWTRSKRKTNRKKEARGSPRKTTKETYSTPPASHGPPISPLPTNLPFQLPIRCILSSKLLIMLPIRKLLANEPWLVNDPPG